MPNPIIAKGQVEVINTGASKPIIVECFNNKKYVLKYLGNRQSDKILINELVCCRLAKQLGILVPEVNIIYIPEELIEIEPILQKLKIPSGLHFGSMYDKDTSSFTGENSLKNVKNKEVIPRIIAFDYWVGNDDRTGNLGNLLIGTSKNGNNIITIDYGSAFNGPDWTKEDLIYTDIHIMGTDGAVYSCLFGEIKDIGSFNSICNDIESLGIRDINKCFNDIPQEWGFNEYYKELMCKFLYDRKDKLRDTLAYILRNKLK